MLIKDIYKNYKILPNLQLHQYRVASVGSIICDNFNGIIDKDTVITACLLHDMGNIIKSKLDLFPQFLEPEGLEYWQKVKEKFIEKYGNDEHKATYQIAKEIGVDEKVLNLILKIGFSNAREIFESNNFEVKITGYADSRVAPYGIVSQRQREDEGRERYKDNKNIKKFNDINEFNKLCDFWEKIEKQIFEKCKIKPKDITDVTTKDIIENLKDYEI